MKVLQSLIAMYRGAWALMLARENRRRIERLEAEVHRLRRLVKFMHYRVDRREKAVRRAVLEASRPSRN